MATLIWLILLLGGAGALAMYRVSLRTATIATAAFLLVYTFAGGSVALAVVGWLLFAAAAVPLNVASIRQPYITRPVFKLFKRILPSMSETERSALKAGTVFWEGELFSGAPDWKVLHKIPAPALSERERAFLDGPVGKLCAMLDEWDITHERGDLTPETWQFLKDEGFFAMIIPQEFGGLEFSAYAHSQVLGKIASRSPTCASMVAVPNSLGPAELLMHYGTDEQKHHYLPRLARGDDIPCFALTAPSAGSDAASIPDFGVVCKGEWEGSEVVGMRLTFDKRYITLAPVATVIGLAFKLHDPDGLLGGDEELGITLALLPRDTKGLEVGRRHYPLNIPFQNGPVRGTDVFVPLDFIVGGRDMAGQGWRMLMECLAVGRSISLPANTTGGAKMASYTTGAYARVRHQFNLPIGRFEGVGEAMARIGGYTYAMNATRALTAAAVDAGEKPAVASAIAKYHVTEMGRMVMNDAMDVHGGKGICLGPRNWLGRNWQVAPVAITVEGANILTRSLIIFGQGAIRCHPYVLEEMEAAQDEDAERGFQAFEQALLGHIGFTISNAVHSFWMGLTRARFSRGPKDPHTRRFYQHLNRFAASFALVADISMLVLGGSLKKREMLSARLGDLLSDLYIASAVLKKFEDDGRQTADLPLVEWGCRTAIYQLQEQMHGFLRNFPNRPASWLMRLLVFPRGRSYSAPSDALCREVAELMMEPTAARDRLSEGIHVPADENDVIGQLAVAHRAVIQAEPARRKLREAVREGKLREMDEARLPGAAHAAGILSDTEYKLLQRADALTAEVIAVDDFDSAVLGRVERPGVLENRA